MRFFLDFLRRILENFYPEMHSGTPVGIIRETLGIILGIFFFLEIVIFEEFQKNLLEEFQKKYHDKSSKRMPEKQTQEQTARGSPVVIPD